jgi:hypothetical protein
VFMNMILKNLKIKGLDEKIVSEAFPNILDWSWKCILVDLDYVNLS